MNYSEIETPTVLIDLAVTKKNIKNYQNMNVKRNNLIFNCGTFNRDVDRSVNELANLLHAIAARLYAHVTISSLIDEVEKIKE